MNSITILLLLVLIIQSSAFHNYFRYNRHIVLRGVPNSHIEVPPLVDLILLEASDVDATKLIEARSIIESDVNGKERSKYLWNSKNDALVSTFQYKTQSEDDLSIETMTLNERINELNIETYDKETSEGTTGTGRSTAGIVYEDAIQKKRGRPKKVIKE